MRISQLPFLALLILATTVSAQASRGGATAAAAPKPSTTDLITTTIDLNRLSPAEAIKLLKPYGTAKAIVSVAGSNSILLTDVSSGISRMRQILTEADRSVAAVTLNFELIQAAEGPISGTYSTVTGQPVSPASAGVDSILRSVLRYNNYKLLGRATGSAGEHSDFSQTVAIDSVNGQYRLRTTVGDIRQADGTGSVRLTVTLSRSTPGVNNTLETVISTGLDVPLGQSVVLGTSAVRGITGALVLVVRPELLVTAKKKQ